MGARTARLAIATEPIRNPPPRSEVSLLKKSSPEKMLNI
jgi:hypothetical protein